MELPKELIDEIRQKTGELATRSFRERLGNQWRLHCLHVSFERIHQNKVTLTHAGKVYYDHTRASAVFTFEVVCDTAKAWSIKKFSGRLRGINLSLMPRECRNVTFDLPKR